MATGPVVPGGSAFSQKSPKSEAKRFSWLTLGAAILALSAVAGLAFWAIHHRHQDHISKIGSGNGSDQLQIPAGLLDVSTDDPRPADFIPYECIIQYKPDVTAEQKAALRSRFKAELKQDLRSLGSISKAEAEPGGSELVTLDLGVQSQAESQDDRKRSELAAIRKLWEDPNVLTAEPNYIIRKADDHFFSNDDYYVQRKLWGVRTTDFEPSTSGKPRLLHKASDSSAPNHTTTPSSQISSTRIKHTVRQGFNKASSTVSNSCSTDEPLESLYSTHADKAWSAGHVGSSAVFVGVVDSGIQANHPDLAANVWQQVGKDFYNVDHEELFASDEDPHGTHVAGIIAAVGGNRIGVTGVVWKTTLVEAKFLGPDGTGDTAGAIQAIRWLTYQRRVKKLRIVAINASWASPRRSPALLSAIKDAGKEGILLVAAAGNDHLNIDNKYKSYPADYDTEHDTDDKSAGIGYDSVISVAAIGKDGSLASFSDFGAHSVHLAAPGVDILSTWTANGYKCDSGTSMAAPFVTGAVAMYASTHPQATAQEIREAILSSVTPDPALTGKVASGGTLNLSTF